MAEESADAGESCPLDESRDVEIRWVVDESCSAETACVAEESGVTEEPGDESWDVD